MSFERGWRILSGFFVLVLLDAAMMPCVAAMPGGQASGVDLKNAISIESITLTPDNGSTKVAGLSVSKAKGSTFESGSFTMTYKMANRKNKVQTVTGRYSETRNADGSSYTRITGEGMVYELSMKPVGLVEDGTLWEIEETRTMLGRSTTNIDTVVIPTEISGEVSKNDRFTAYAAKTKIDVPRYVPSDAILFFNDVRMSDLIYGGAVLGVLAGVVCLPAGAIIEIVVLTAEWQTSNSGVSSSNIYLDIYLWPKGLGKTYAGGSNGLYVEVDYYYL